MDTLAFQYFSAQQGDSGVDAESVPIAESGTLTIPNIVWDRTKSISAAIAPLASQTIIGRAAVDGVAASLGISRRQV